MKTNHTPDNWKSTGLEIRHENTGLILANVYKHLEANQPKEESLANAKLIAAAPELLKALKMMMREHEDQLELAESLKIANEAIKKATT